MPRVEVTTSFDWMIFGAVLLCCLLAGLLVLLVPLSLHAQAFITGGGPPGGGPPAAIGGGGGGGDVKQNPVNLNLTIKGVGDGMAAGYVAGYAASATTVEG